MTSPDALERRSPVRAALVSIAVLVLLLGLVFAAAARASSYQGTWVSADGGSRAASLVIGPNGKVGGNDGCNTLGGTWSAEADGIRFSGIMQTMMFCEGVDTWLSGLDSASLDGDTLVVRGRDGETIGVLVRQAGPEVG